MLSSAALRGRIASVLDVLSRAAVAEIARVVEENTAVLRLQMCQREHEMKELEKNMEALHAELRAAQERIAAGEDCQSHVVGERTSCENVCADKDDSPSVPEVQVTLEPMEEDREEARGPAAGEQNLLSAPSPSPLDSGPAVPCSSSPQQSSAVWRRAVKTLRLKKSHLCLNCGKCFGRARNLARHKLVHTGEKPYRCDICGRAFNRKCSLKVHMKLHVRYIQPGDAEIRTGEEKLIPELNPCTGPHRPEDERQPEVEDVLRQNQDVVPTPAQVKSEPVEENITPAVFHGGGEQTREAADALSERLAVERDQQQRLSGLKVQDNKEMIKLSALISAEYLGSSAQDTASFAGMVQVLQAHVEAPCSTFSFPGKPYGELASGMIPQAPYGSSDTALISSESGPRGAAEGSSSHHQLRRSRAFQGIKPKSFVCSYCSKVFGSSGQLERHLLIHTGKKPYGCLVCGRCFSQKSNLKRHMMTHRNDIQPGDAEIRTGEEKLIPEVNPCAGPHHPDDERQPEVEDVLRQNRDVVPTPAQVKSEPVEENITPAVFHGGGEQTREAADALSERLAVERDQQQRLSGIQVQDNKEMISAEYLGSSAQDTASFAGMVQVLQAHVEAPCSTFSFPGKPYGELASGMIPQAPYGSSDTALISSASGPRGTAEGSSSHHQLRRSRAFQGIKPKSFLCSYCSKVFRRPDQLASHLIIHTGEKPYGCLVCGRCFSQKSSLKSHMKTHRNGETTDQLLFAVPDNQPLEKEPKTKGSAFDFHSVNQSQTNNISGEPDQSQLWTCGTERSSGAAEQNVCVLLNDVKYISPAAAASREQQGYMSPVKDLPFLHSNAKEELMHSDQYSVMQMQPINSNMSLIPELQVRVTQEVAVNDYSRASDGTQGHYV